MPNPRATHAGTPPGHVDYLSVKRRCTGRRISWRSVASPAASLGPRPSALGAVGDYRARAADETGLSITTTSAFDVSLHGKVSRVRHAQGEEEPLGWSTPSRGRPVPSGHPLKASETELFQMLLGRT